MCYFQRQNRLSPIHHSVCTSTITAVLAIPAMTTKVFTCSIFYRSPGGGGRGNWLRNFFREKFLWGRGHSENSIECVRVQLSWWSAHTHHQEHQLFSLCSSAGYDGTFWRGLLRGGLPCTLGRARWYLATLTPSSMPLHDSVHTTCPTYTNKSSSSRSVSFMCPSYSRVLLQVKLYHGF